MAKTKTAKIVIYLPFQLNGWGAHVLYRQTDYLNRVFSDKRDAMGEAIEKAKNEGFTHALILEDYGRLNQKPYRIAL